MINKKEDLTGTYIKNDNGELRELYVAICEKFLVNGTPKDLMMSNDKWLGPNAGCKFIGVCEGGMWIGNNCWGDDKEIEISDLKTITTETPEEKEALDAIEQVEWNGEGLPNEGEKVVIRYMYDSKTVCHCGIVLFSSESHCILDINGKECHYLMCDYQYEKPETPEAKKEREELEAAYDLFCTFKSAVDMSIISFDDFCNHRPLEGWVAMVRKTKYRKGE